MFSLIADDELFVDVEGYEGRYFISNYGRVYSNRPKREKFLKPTPSHKGYLTVCLCKDRHQKTSLIHILVGNAFVGKRENGLTFDHIDRNRQNNKASNLRLATPSEQVINQKLRINNKTGEKNIHIWIDQNEYQYYKIKIVRNKKLVFNKILSIKNHSLEDAIKIRDDFLKN